jgi:peptidoglycan-N-acetylglucosamine deacetylase
VSERSGRTSRGSGSQASAGVASTMSRRTLVGMLGVGLAAWLAGCAAPPVSAAPVHADPSTTPLTPARPPAPPPGRPIALTIDDGYASGVVAGYVEFARRTGIHLTFSPNGTYSTAWGSQAKVLRPLIDAGQVQIMNHTFSHRWLTRIPAGQVRQELERNEQWIATTFATSSRPYWRPPYGAHNAAVDAIAREAGFPTPVMWTGSYGDATTVTPRFLLDQARRYLTPGKIVLGHANHPTILGLFDQISGIIHERGLQPVTLDEFFGTRRP